MSESAATESAVWRARACEAVGRTAELTAERAVLEEAREGLRADERERVRRLADQEGLVASRQERLRALEQQGAALQREIDAAQEEIDTLVRQCAVEGRFGSAARSETRLLERQLTDQTDDLRAAETALESARQGLARMKTKLVEGARRPGTVGEDET